MRRLVKKYLMPCFTAIGEHRLGFKVPPDGDETPRFQLPHALLGDPHPVGFALTSPPSWASAGSGSTTSSHSLR
jgi:hypothetical protein